MEVRIELLASIRPEGHFRRFGPTDGRQGPGGVSKLLGYSRFEDQKRRDGILTFGQYYI